MHRIAIAGLSVLVCTVGCVLTKPTASNSSATPVSNSKSQTSELPDYSVASKSGRAPSPATDNRAQSAQNSIAAATRSEDTTNRADVARSESLTAKSSAKPVTPDKATMQPETQAATSAPVVKTSGSPPLDLATLQQRLRETHAIGVFAKLSLKNQIDDLLGEFRDFYAGKMKTPLARLRERYDLLVIKVLTLLQDSDSSLAAAISASREAIWSILADPKKFTQIS